MRVDLYTDASIVHGRGAWAALVIRDGHDREEAFGALRGTFKSSCATEIAAIANGIHWASKLGLIARGDEVVAWCDNIAAIWWANGFARVKQSSDPMLLNARRSIRDRKKNHGFTFKAEHIKGHQRLDTDDPRAIFNMRCDELCSAVRDGRDAPEFADLERRIALALERRARREAKAA